MQPQELEGIQTLADWIYQQFAPTDPIEVQNISQDDYNFRYCVGEDIVSSDPTSKQVVERKYEEKYFKPGETAILMGAAAYIFVDGVARRYVFEQSGAEATADIAQLVTAAKKAIIGKVGYSTTTPLTSTKIDTEELRDRGGVPVGHNPNAVKDNAGDLPPATNSESEFEDANVDDEPELRVVPADKETGEPAKFFIGDQEVTADEYNEAQNARSNK